jgi:predicted ester cyclase
MNINDEKSESNMTDQEKNKQVISVLLDVVWRQGKLDRLSDFWTSDCINHADPAAVPGLEALHDYHASFSGILSALSDVSLVIERQVAEGDLVTTQINMKARHTGELLGIPASGREVELASIRIDRLANGKIAEHWSVTDMAAFTQQLKS